MSRIGDAFAYGIVAALVVPLVFTLFKTRYQFLDVALAAAAGAALYLIPTVGGVASFFGTLGILYWRVAKGSQTTDIVAAAVAARLACIPVLLWMHSGAIAKDNLHGRLLEMSRIINEGLPKLVADGVRLDSTAVEARNALTSVYSLVSLKAEELAIDRFMEEVEPQAARESCSGSMRDILDRGGGSSTATRTGTAR